LVLELELELVLLVLLLLLLLTGISKCAVLHNACTPASVLDDPKIFSAFPFVYKLNALSIVP
jgi:hypothetical protein